MQENAKTSNLMIFLKTFVSRGIIVKISLVIAILFIFCAILAPFLTSYNPNDLKLNDALLKASSKHLLGCDAYGRDVLTRLLYGARVSLMAGCSSTFAAAVTGMLLGLVAGYYEGKIGSVIMSYVDVQLSIPPLLFTIVIGLIVGHGFGGLIFALSFGYVPGFVRLMYGVVLSVKGNDYIVAARIANIKTYNIFIRHILPNSFPPMIIMVVLTMGMAIMLESTLSFLGIGIQTPTASWGNMVADGYTYLFQAPLLAFMPGICITITVVAINVLGDSLRDSLDPRLRGKL